MHDDTDEQQNEEVIGTVFRWSMVIFGLIGFVVLAIVFWPQLKSEDGVIEKKTGEISSLFMREQFT